jgi:catechol 2,3-dioxygenase-like lactoylglutathione lyase family enzyme
MVDMHLEVNVIPVSDVERSKKFYDRLGWRLDDDVAPAGSASSSTPRQARAPR